MRACSPDHVGVRSFSVVASLKVPVALPHLVCCRDVVEAANNNLRSYSFAIKEVRTEGDGKLFYVYSNEVSYLTAAKHLSCAPGSACLRAR